MRGVRREREDGCGEKMKGFLVGVLVLVELGE